MSMTDPDCRGLFELFFQPGEVAEIRALGLHGKGSWEGYAKGTVSGYFNDPVKFTAAIESLDKAKAEGVYFCLNPVNPALLARANNRLIVPKATTTDDQILCHKWLPIDCDPLRPTGISATDEEVEAAINCRNQIAGWLEPNGFPQPVMAFSGNGGHLLYGLPNLPNSKEFTKLKQDALKALAGRFNSAQVAVDEKVFNPARIIKAYGTWARKGDSTEDRPHRQSFIEYTPNPIIPITLEQLKWLADQTPRAEAANPPRSEHHQDNGTLRTLDVEVYLQHYGIQIARVKREASRSIYGLQRCFFNPEHATNDASIIQMADGKLLFQCFHNSCQGRSWAEARQMISGSDNLSRFCDGYNPGPIIKNTDDQTKKAKTRGLTLDNLKNQFSGEVRYLWRSHFAEGMPTMVNGREGDGKTTICMQAGKEILEQNPNGLVIWLATEGAVQDTVVKMERLQVGDRFLVAQKADGSFKYDFTRYEDLKELSTLLDSFDKPILAVFIDSLRGATTLDDNDSKIKNVIQKLNALVCDKYKASLIYIHHFSKGQKSSLLDRSTGTTAITSSVRVVLSVLPVSKYKRIIKQAKSNISATMPELEVIEVDGKIIIREPAQHSDETMTASAEEFLINLFKERETIPAREVYEAGEKIGLSDSLLKKVKNILGIDARKDAFNQPWLWTWPLYAGNRIPSENDQNQGTKSVVISITDTRDTRKKEVSTIGVSLETQKGEDIPRDTRDTRDTRDILENSSIPSSISSVHKGEQPIKEKHIEGDPGDELRGCYFHQVTNTCRAAYHIELLALPTKKGLEGIGCLDFQKTGRCPGASGIEELMATG